MVSTPMPSVAPNDLLELLRQDHLKIDELFFQFSKAESDDEKQHIVEQIYIEFLPHAQAEEEIFYPALRNADVDEDDVDEAYAEHASARKTIENILKSDPDDMTFDAKVKMLQKAIQHHVREEETVLFQEARDSGLDLQALAQQVWRRKDELRPVAQRDVANLR